MTIEEKIKNILKQEWMECDHIERFEAWADLYYKRFNVMSPGKSDLFPILSSIENIAQCEAWHKTGLAAHDAIMEVIRLNKKIEELESKIENFCDY